MRGQVILSMDMAGYSVDMRRTIARISGMQGDAAEESKWLALADKVSAAVAPTEAAATLARSLRPFLFPVSAC